MEPSFESLIANLTGAARRATLNGREYLVVPVTMIVPGVLSGSAGSLYYPPDEVRNSVQAWDGVPLTHRHPVVNGSPVSARSPAVADKVWLGYVFNSRFTDKLVAEAWFDVMLTNRVDPRIIPRLEAGHRVEVSTGLFLNTHAAPDGSSHEGRAYSRITSNYRPDHLAVLMDEVGACSVRDGCGLNVNSLDATATHTPGGPSVNKEQLIGWLTANCSCWKGPSAATALNAMTDAELAALKETAESNLAANKQLATITNALSNGFIVNGAKVTLAADGTFKAEQVAAPASPAKPLELTPVGQPTANRTESFLELLERTGTPEEKAAWNMAVEMNRREKTELVERITANFTDPAAKAQAVAVYNALDVKELRKIAPAPAPTANSAPGSVNYALGAGGPLVNQNTPAAMTIREVGAKPLIKMTFANPLKK